MNLIKAFVLSLIITLTSQASQAASLIMDAETINWLEEMAEPLLKRAELDPKDVNIYVIKSDDINAFVTANNDIYFYTGLILKAEHPAEVQGVLAHEIGHIKGRHHLKNLANQEKQKVPTVIGTVLGLGAIMAGNAEAANALLISGIATAQTNMLRHSRTHERQADNIAAALLNENGYSAEGLASFFEKLRGEQLLYSKTPPSYLLTHPLPSQRINAVEEHIKNEKLKDKAEGLDVAEFKRIQAKLTAFVKSHGYINRVYSRKDTEEAHYAMVILKALQGKTDESIKILENELEHLKNNAFYWELLALLYQDKSDYILANEAYRKAVELKPESDLLRLSYAQNLINIEEYKDAIHHLKTLKHNQPKWAPVLKTLGIAYGKDDQLGLSHLELAEEALLRRRTSDVKLHLRIAKKHINSDDETLQNRLTMIKEQLGES